SDLTSLRCESLILALQPYLPRRVSSPHQPVDLSGFPLRILLEVHCFSNNRYVKYTNLLPELELSSFVFLIHSLKLILPFPDDLKIMNNRSEEHTSELHSLFDRVCRLRL